MSKKFVLLTMCVVITGFLVLSSQKISANADVLPTTAPIEETIISQEDAYATQTARPTVYATEWAYPIPTDNYYENNPYPEPESMSLEDILISIFGKPLLNGKQSMQKR